MLMQPADSAFDLSDNPISRLRYSPRRRALSRLRAERNASGPTPAQRHGLDLCSAEGSTAREHHFDYAAVVAQAEDEDLELIRIAAKKLSAALCEVHVLLGRGRGAEWKRDALARCTAKQWIVIQGDPSADRQTYRVTPEGYRAAGLRQPLFAS